MFMDLNLTVPNFVYNPLNNSIDLTPERAPEYPSHYDFYILQHLAHEGPLTLSMKISPCTEIGTSSK